MSSGEPGGGAVSRGVWGRGYMSSGEAGRGAQNEYLMRGMSWQKVSERK